MPAKRVALNNEEGTVTTVPSSLLSLMRMIVGGCCVFTSVPAMFVSGSCVLLGLFMFTDRVVMLCLMMVMCRSMMVSGRLMMMFCGWMFR